MPSDFLPRSVLGDYLTWVGDHLRRSAPPYVKIVAHRTEAVDIDRDADGRLMVRCADGRTLTVGRAFLTTGYGGGGPPFPDGGRERVRHPYPLPLATAGVRPGETLAVLGFGLSALDLVASVTVGRGGRFTEYGDRLVYLPGGAEPTVLLASRSGVPARCRPPLPVRRPKFRPRFLDVAAIEELRGRPGGQVDFERDALPLVYDEMRLAYRRAQLRGYGPDPDALPTAALRKQLDDWDEELGRFDAAASLAGSANMSLVDGSRYHEWVAEAIRSDLAAARKLPNGTPLKCATEALVDLFQAIQAVLVPGLITDRSLETFSAITGPAIRRAAVGPYHDRQRELLALLDAGVVRAPSGLNQSSGSCHGTAGRSARRASCRRSVNRCAGFSRATCLPRAWTRRRAVRWCPRSGRRGGSVVIGGGCRRSVRLTSITGCTHWMTMGGPMSSFGCWDRCVKTQPSITTSCPSPDRTRPASRTRIGVSRKCSPAATTERGSPRPAGDEPGDAVIMPRRAP